MGKTKTKTDQAALPLPGDKEFPLTVAQPAAQQPTIVQADPIFAIIERLAKDPNFDVEKMERLINMHDRAKAALARTDFDQAMSQAQKEMMTIRAGSKSDKGKYASYAALDRAIRPIYTKHGFSVSFDTDPTAPELTVRLIATVAHSGGHRERRQLDVPADGKGAKGGDVMTRTHATASAVTYGKRYLSSMIWNLAVDKDDDGNAAGDRAKAWTDAAIQQLNTTKLDKASLEKYRADNEKSINWLKRNAPEEFARFSQALSNAAEAAGIPKAEPRRGKQQATDVTDQNDKASAGASPHSDPQEGGQQPHTAGGATNPDGAPQSASKPMTFKKFPKTSEFIEAFEYFVEGDDRCTPETAAAWLKFYGNAIAICRASQNADTKAYIETLVTMAQGIAARAEAKP